jgi:isochorismate pyruvate lyase
MPENILPFAIEEPATCSNMAEVRRGVDALDQAMVTLLAKRFDYMLAAARIKSDRDVVRDEERKSQVISQAAKMAADFNIPVTAITDIWEILVEASITFELDAWDHMRR